MARLAIALIGPMQVTLDGQPIARFETEKARALLAYLAVEADRPHRREVLAEMLWSDRPSGAALANLRHTLATLRRAIGDALDAQGVGHAAAPPFLLVTRQTIQFNPASDAGVDVRAFLDLLHTSRPTEQPSTQSLEEAVGLCRGAFLEDLSVADCAVLEEWMLLTRERLARLTLDALYRLTTCYERRGQWKRALQHAWRQVELEPWDERAQRHVMRLLALTGQRSAALAQYEVCRTTLAEGLGVEPEAETTALFDQIRDGEIAGPSPARENETPSRLPRFLLESASEAAPPVFVAREQELSQLACTLDRALQGTGGVVFCTGEPGQGKTALLAAFARRAMGAHPDLLVAWGDCDAYAGAGDPYLPFRDAMGMLTGDLESRWLAGSIGRDHARRLWAALPLVIPALLADGPSLVGALLDGDALLARVAAAMPERADWHARLRALAGRARSGREHLEQRFLFEQCARVLRAVAAQHPLLLVLDDLQWADSASLSLLFHLGRRLARSGSRILIACAYRPEELVSDRDGERHPLHKVMHEFERTLGQVRVDLDASGERVGREFVDAFLDTEPNQLGEAFRAALYRRTEGHPLFTIELLRALQERGALVRREEDGAWIEGPRLAWEMLPARVEAVIEERVSRLDPSLREIVDIASVEGEAFTAQVVAAVQHAALGPLLRDLAMLERTHRLVVEQGEAQTGAQRADRYRFGHALVQEYVYRSLGQGERRLLHGQVAAALERLYAGQEDEIAAQLAEHWLRAGDDGAALRYYAKAAASAARRYAHQEATALYARALQLGQRGTLDGAALADLHLKRGMVYRTLGRFEPARADLESAIHAGQAAGDRLAEWRALLALGQLWNVHDYAHSRSYIDRALQLAQRIGDPVVLAQSLNRLGNWHLNAEDLPAAIAYHQQALAIAEQTGDQEQVASTLDLLGIATALYGDLTASVEHYDRAIALFRAHKNAAALGASLTGRGVVCSGPHTSPTLVSPALAVDPLEDLEDALGLARETGSPAAEAWALWAQALAYTGRGRFGLAFDAVHTAQDIASAIGHHEWMAGSHGVLGTLYVELLAPEEARPELEQALALAERLSSRHWVHQATGELAVACCMLGDLAQAQAHLDRVLTLGTGMDSLHKRTCWARRAELALLQGDPALALDIVERLIRSAPGMAPGRTITLLWKLKAEALIAVGQTGSAGALLQAAIENAQAPGERFLRWRLHASMGRLYRATNRGSEAKRAFATARQLVGELADTIPAQVLRERYLRRAHAMLAPSP
ncbi:MAG: AAA family ATPase [Anaerolineae bacterium]|nr:AAA family ATPase [Anaerolineae bacterium]